MLPSHKGLDFFQADCGRFLVFFLSPTGNLLSMLILGLIKLFIVTL